MRILNLILIVIIFSACEKSKITREGVHPNLILTPGGVTMMQSNIGKVPLFDKTLQTIRQLVNTEIERGIEVPVPKDLAGGYTHERHKVNFITMQQAGILFQITGEEKYAVYIKDMLVSYAEIYPTFEKHPANRSYARGKFFWQCLNDANWLVYTAQAYDCIYDWLDVNTVNHLNTKLFRPYADYISFENPMFFNRLHNHSTWGNAGVGMIGLVMNDEELIDRALYAFDIDSASGSIDNDGGQIDLMGYKEGGFLAQIDHSFSPDGYYTEGPYYQRYAMYPFLVFAQALANKKPELEIFNYRNGLLIKAVYALINQTNGQGEFFPINDAQKGMSLSSQELVFAVSMAYHFGGNDTGLLSIIQKQGRVPLNDLGLAAAIAINDGKATSFEFKSLELSDGAAGDEGAIGIIRADNLTLVMKYAKHGMGHGHFDRLGFLLYDNHGEVIQDYGSARWVNIEHKDGGGYLKENHSWAKETLAHNTLVVNKRSHFDHKVKAADKSPGTPYFFSSNDEIQIVSAKELNAYEDVMMHRTMAVINLNELENPLVIDLFSVLAAEGTRYDLPIYYVGEFMSSNQNFHVHKELLPMGMDAGYQHLWEEAKSNTTGDLLQFTWFNKKSFFTMTSAIKPNDQVLMTRIGANDPNFNLRRDPGIMLRRTDGNTVFASLYEIHGSYDYTTERPFNLYTSIADFDVVFESKDYVAVQIEIKTGVLYQLAFSLNDKSLNSSHSIMIDNSELAWKGVYDFRKIKIQEHEKK